jgi:hypothetical protein
MSLDLAVFLPNSKSGVHLPVPCIRCESNGIDLNRMPRLLAAQVALLLGYCRADDLQEVFFLQPIAL